LQNALTLNRRGSDLPLLGGRLFGGGAASPREIATPFQNDISLRTRIFLNNSSGNL